MLAVNFVQFMANLLIAGFVIRSFQRMFPDTVVTKALAVIY